MSVCPIIHNSFLQFMGRKSSSRTGSSSTKNGSLQDSDRDIPSRAITPRTPIDAVRQKSRGLDFQTPERSDHSQFSIDVAKEEDCKADHMATNRRTRGAIEEAMVQTAARHHQLLQARVREEQKNLHEAPAHQESKITSSWYSGREQHASKPVCNFALVIQCNKRISLKPPKRHREAVVLQALRTPKPNHSNVPSVDVKTDGKRLTLRARVLCE